MGYVISFSRAVRDFFGDVYDAFVQGMGDLGEQQRADWLRDAEERTRQAVNDLREEMHRMRAELHRMDAHLAMHRAETMALFAELRAELRSEFQQGQARQTGHLLRWMFLFWIGQVAALAGILALWKG